MKRSRFSEEQIAYALRTPLQTGQTEVPQADIEDMDSRTRGIERSAVMSLALGKWVTQDHAVLITGATGASIS